MGWGKEDTWYYGDRWIGGEELSPLRTIYRKGKIVLAIDYPGRLENVCRFYKMRWKDFTVPSTQGSSTCPSPSPAALEFA